MVGLIYAVEGCYLLGMKYSVKCDESKCIWVMGEWENIQTIFYRVVKGEKDSK
jgi:hypothetical protein